MRAFSFSYGFVFKCMLIIFSAHLVLRSLLDVPSIKNNVTFSTCGGFTNQRISIIHGILIAHYSKRDVSHIFSRISTIAVISCNPAQAVAPLVHSSFDDTGDGISFDYMYDFGKSARMIPKVLPNFNLIRQEVVEW